MEPESFYQVWHNKSSFWHPEMSGKKYKTYKDAVRRAEYLAANSARPHYKYRVYHIEMVKRCELVSTAKERG